jgi:hypothetical protein
VMSDRAVFYADVLGFSRMSSASGAESTVDALSDLAVVLSDTGDIARFLRRGRWRARYGLSDSLFLVGNDVVATCGSGAELYYSLAYLNSHADRDLVLLRGSSHGR